MLERDLARLAGAGPEVSLDGLEQCIWAKVDGLDRLSRLEQISSRVQWGALAVTLIASGALGNVLAYASRPSVLPLSSVAAELAPSTLLATAR